MSLQRSVRLGLTHFTLTRLVAHFLYTLINIRYAWGLPCLTASEDMSLLPFFGAKVWRCSLNHDKDRRLSRFHDNFRGRLPHLVTPDERLHNMGIPRKFSRNSLHDAVPAIISCTEKELYSTRHTRWHKQAFSHILTSIPLSVTTIIHNVCGEKERWHWYAGMRIFFFYTLVYLKKTQWCE